ncbi:hypothetical protein BV22DRAFT_1134417 [Leucogyrophana mollusca]|uniref:Uncharacterized protein n=1 Tax=Leucogyrophana mollusca TaxID=85980 RepID=A0ACB8AZD6_9AGAM|nr:hypothetical protein BV22DRAFT_1134417 [Leucogyrophana mollusca]
MVCKINTVVGFLVLAVTFGSARPLTPDSQELLYAFNLDTYTGHGTSGYHFPGPNQYGIHTKHPNGASLCKNLDGTTSNHLHAFKFDPIMDPKNMELTWYYGTSCKRKIPVTYKGPHTVKATPSDVVWASSFKVTHYGNN